MTKLGDIRSSNLKVGPTTTNGSGVARKRALQRRLNNTAQLYGNNTMTDSKGSENGQQHGGVNGNSSDRTYFLNLFPRMIFRNN
jgi:hypothetical protein